MGYKVPILFLIYNRQKETETVFKCIRDIRPDDMFVVADGPKKENTDDILKCNNTRDVVNNNVDWECNLTKIYRKENMGCKLSVYNGISEFMNKYGYGIILEDDTVPNKSFFKYCEELLEKYKNDERIAVISGDNFIPSKHIKNSYEFSKYPLIWGWATWKRVWDKYDVSMKEWEHFKKDEMLDSVFDTVEERKYWTNIFNKQYNNEIDAWDYQLSFLCMKNKLLSIYPKYNLVKNIGIGSKDAAHTKKYKREYVKETSELMFPLDHPNDIYINRDNDLLISRLRFGIKKKNIYTKIKNIFKKVLRV